MIMKLNAQLQDCHDQLIAKLQELDMWFVIMIVKLNAQLKDCQD